MVLWRRRFFRNHSIGMSSHALLICHASEEARNPIRPLHNLAFQVIQKPLRVPQTLGVTLVKPLRTAIVRIANSLRSPLLGRGPWWGDEGWVERAKEGDLAFRCRRF